LLGTPEEERVRGRRSGEGECKRENGGRKAEREKEKQKEIYRKT
jgi:hypothetical protein